MAGVPIATRRPAIRSRADIAKTCSGGRNEPKVTFSRKGAIVTKGRGADARLCQTATVQTGKADIRTFVRDKTGVELLQPDLFKRPSETGRGYAREAAERPREVLLVLVASGQRDVGDPRRRIDVQFPREFEARFLHYV